MSDSPSRGRRLARLRSSGALLAAASGAVIVAGGYFAIKALLGGGQERACAEVGCTSGIYA